MHILDIRGRTHPRIWAALTLLPLASGCASFSGQASPVLDLSTIQQVSTKYSPGPALEKFYATKDATLQKAYRDEVIGAYLIAADQRYMEFRRQVSQQMKGTNLLLEIGVIGLTAGASIATEATANTLSAIAAGVAGSRANISKELWFEKTLPAIVSAMDTRRTKVRTTIMVRMREPAASYSLTEALSDLSLYQEAASFESAISAVTSASAQKADEAEAIYKQEVAFYSAAPEAGVAELRGEIKRALGAQVADKAAIDRAAATVGVDPQATPAETAQAVLKLLLVKTSATEVAAILSKIKEALKDPVQ